MALSKKRKPSVSDVPPNFQAIVDAIRESRDMLEWEDNWDDEGSPGYNESTWDRANNFVTLNAVRLWREKGVSIMAPTLFPGPDGSIDIRWRTNNRELYVNIPADATESATYYGYSESGEITKGNLNLSAQNYWLLAWMSD